MNDIFHSGTPQRYDNDPKGSGRYRQGTGKNPHQRDVDFIDQINSLKKKGMKEVEIAKYYGMKSTDELRKEKQIANERIKQAQYSKIKKLKQKGLSNTQIAKQIGVSGESQVRSIVKQIEAPKKETIDNIAEKIKSKVSQKTYLDVSRGVEHQLGVSKTRLGSAVKAVENEGYSVHTIKVDQMGVTGQKTNMKVVAPPGTEWKKVIQNTHRIHSFNEYTDDNGKTWKGIERPKSVDSNRIKIRYGDEGGKEKDGVIELRRGVEDISLGSARYAQVRIAVDGTHYLKGMAIYNDDMPKGIDIIFNTNKKSGTPKEDVFKPMAKNMQNPFGSTLMVGRAHGFHNGQRHYIDKNGKEQLSAINIVNIEDDWFGWRKSLASQMLAKQPKELAKQQLDLTYKNRKAEFEEIKTITNPTIKKAVLHDFFEDLDKSAVHLQAAALPRQRSHVILPIGSLKDTEVYAPNYDNGESVALIRYPHAGLFEIPILKVNNNNKEGKSIITPNSSDAIGINSRVAEKLSGADFDGDTVLVIPISDRARIASEKTLKDLENFDPKEAYPYREGMRVMTKKNKQPQMGQISNLITDMTIKGATPSELARAVKHSMVVIDAEKHKLDYELSYKENDILGLKKKYQTGGASTLLSSAKSPVYVPKRYDKWYDIDPDSGRKIFKEAKVQTYTDKNGKVHERRTKSTKMAEVFNEGKDAKVLSSGTDIENIYANYANKINAMANEARKLYLTTKEPSKNISAAKVYKDEVDSLKNKVKIAELNSPRERKALIISNNIVRAQVRDNPDLKDDKERLKKIRTQAINEARERTGAIPIKERYVPITPKEWEAIQAYAIPKTTLKSILDNTDTEELMKLALPKTRKGMSSAKLARAKAMKSNGYTIAEIADMLGVSPSTVNKALNE